MSGEGVELSVVLPVYNEEENLPILLDEIATALGSAGMEYEIVAVNDGSNDRSLAVLEELRARHSRLRVISFRRNSGQSAAIDAGVRASRGELVVTLDSDLQNDPADIPAMLAELRSRGVDMVAGVRVKRQDSRWKKLQSAVGNGVRNFITGDRITDTGCSLKLFRRAAVERIPLFSGMHRFLPTLLRMQGFTVVEMAVNHRPRRYGTTKYGAMNRAARGLVDCFAVRWLKSRSVRYELEKSE